MTRVWLACKISFVTSLVVDYKQLLDEVFCDIQNCRGRGRGYHNPYRDLDYSGYHKNRI